MSAAKHAISCMACLLLFFFTAKADETLTAGQQLLSHLHGAWSGEAVQTPIGPRPYAIDFQHRGDHCVRGVANNGFSHHHWMFCITDPGPMLEFLSDFRGNEEVITMPLRSNTGNRFHFRPDTHTFMDVILVTGTNSTAVRIMHHGELHVEIHWQRTGVKPVLLTIP